MTFDPSLASCNKEWCGTVKVMREGMRTHNHLVTMALINQSMHACQSAHGSRWSIEISGGVCQCQISVCIAGPAGRSQVMVPKAIWSPSGHWVAASRNDGKQHVGGFGHVEVTQRWIPARVEHCLHRSLSNGHNPFTWSGHPSVAPFKPSNGRHSIANANLSGQECGFVHVV